MVMYVQNAQGTKSKIYDNHWVKNVIQIVIISGKEVNSHDRLFVCLFVSRINQILLVESS